MNAINSGVFLTGLGQFPAYATGRRHTLSGIELDGSNIERYNHTLAIACPDTRPLSADQIASAGRTVLARVCRGKGDHFVSRGIAGAVKLQRFADDPDWPITDALRSRIEVVVSYVAGRGDLIPDEVPVIGRFDDAVLVDLLLRDIGAELDDYDDFCCYRDEVAERCAAQPGTVHVSVDDWLRARTRAAAQAREARLGGYAAAPAFEAFRIG